MTAPKSELLGGRYVLVRSLGAGTQGETYEAIDRGPHADDAERRPDLAERWSRYVQNASGGKPPPPGAGRSVAIKCFRLATAKAWKDVELAEREAKTLASLDHPHLPKYIEHFERDGALYLVMEKIEGESIAVMRARGHSWSSAEVTRMLEDIGAALRYIHGRSPVIVHRDVKPGNVIQRPDGSFALVDFGAVRDRLRPTGGSTVVGTFGFMAPEQFQGRASPRSDLYGLSATALVMLTGEEPEDLPHEGLGIDVERALPRGTPGPLVRALSAMLVPDPDRRAESVDAALAFLRPAPAVSPREPGRRERRVERREQKRAAREEKRRRRKVARSRRPPIVPRLAAQLGLLIALVAVWIAVGIVTPAILLALSLIFGGALQRAAGACVRAARRSQAALGRASAWVSGHRREDLADGAERVRIAPETARVRVPTSAEPGPDLASDATELDEPESEPPHRAAVAGRAAQARSAPPRK